MANRKLSLKNAADSKLVRTLTHEDNRTAVIGGAVALGLVVAGIAALFLTPQGKQARAQIAETHPSQSNRASELGNRRAVDRRRPTQ